MIGFERNPIEFVVNLLTSYLSFVPMLELTSLAIEWTHIIFV